MNPLIYVVALIVLATVIGVIWKRGQGRVKAGRGEAAEFAASGATVTLLQFSTEVCAPCVATHKVLDAAANARDGVAHVDVDITHRADIASRFNILQTPTTLILDRNGAVRARIGGAVKRATVNEQLDLLLETV